MTFKPKLVLGALAIGAVVGLAGLGLAGVAAAQDAPAASSTGSPNAWHPHHRPGMMLGGGLLIALRQLNLTAAQQQQVRAILHTAREQQRADGRGADRSEFLVLSNPGDPNYATALQAAEQRASARVEQAGQVEQQIYGVLTAAQQQALPGVLSNLQANHHWQHEAPSAAPPAG
jgi:Spy/CpxP family protein refolding chaperone